MFSRFLFCSGLAALVNLLCGQLLYGAMGFDGTFGYAASVSVAFLAGMGVSFVLNRRFTYAPSGRETPDELRDFTAVSLGGLALNTGLAHVLVTALRGLEALPLPASPESTAHIGAVGLTAFYSFFAHKHLSFRRKTGKPDLTASRAGQET